MFRDGETWAAYVAGVLLVLARERAVAPDFASSCGPRSRKARSQLVGCG